MTDHDQALRDGSDAGTPAPARPARTKKKYVPAVTPRLRIVLMIVFSLFALLAANSIYLASITFLSWISSATYEDYFYLWMFLLHLVLGLLVIGPFLIFATFHLMATRKRRNRRAVRIGYTLLTISIVMLVSGVLLTRVIGIELKDDLTRRIIYWAHVLSPLAAIWLYWLHRLAGPPIKWRVGLVFGGAVALVLVPMIYLQYQDPRKWSVAGSPDGIKYFEPSLSLTSDGNFISAEVLDNDEYCMKCHADIYEDWSHSAHRFSSFNNPAYLTSIVELRDRLMERDGDVKASRWCAGCHDPVPFFSGQFDDPDYDVYRDPTAHAGITCTTCHAITHVNSNRGNADFTIEEPIHYPFAFSENPVLQWINNQLVRAKPSFHKQVMLKPLHQTPEFCGACHKVHLPRALNHYRDFLRGQNHYDSYHLSGVSGHGLRSFYYPPEAETNCNGCHMPLQASNDFGARPFDGSGELQVHSHLFPSANTAIAWLRDEPSIIEAHQEFLEGVMRVDLFGIKEGVSVEEPVRGPVRPEVPELQPGSTYLLETVIRTLKMGHHFTQGTVDSNEVWLDVTVFEGARYDADGQRTGGQVVGRSGGRDEKGEVDRWAHFVNVFLLDRDGFRINRRNANDIFVPLYNHQIPPGAGQVVHYQLEVPADVKGPLTVEIKLQYRKFDQEYMDLIADFHRAQGLPLRGQTDSGDYINLLPITTLASDRVTFPIAGIDAMVTNPESAIPAWQRWNDYGIGLLLEAAGSDERGELRQAEEAFSQVESLGQFHGPINLARVYQSEGRLSDAAAALERAVAMQNQPGYPAWTVLWLNGVINSQGGYFDEAIVDFRAALEYRTEETAQRNFDFSQDYVVINALAQTYFERSKVEARIENLEGEREFLELARDQFARVLELDSEDFEAHYGLSQVYDRLGESELADHHRELHQRYEPDYNARDSAVVAAQQRYPAGNYAAETLVIYKLHREGAPELESRQPGQP